MEDFSALFKRPRKAVVMPPEETSATIESAWTSEDQKEFQRIMGGKELEVFQLGDIVQYQNEPRYFKIVATTPGRVLFYLERALAKTMAFAKEMKLIKRGSEPSRPAPTHMPAKNNGTGISPSNFPSAYPYALAMPPPWKPKMGDIVGVKNITIPGANRFRYEISPYNDHHWIRSFENSRTYAVDLENIYLIERAEHNLPF